MSVSTENSSKKSPGKVAAEKPVSVYSVNFARVINNLTGEKMSLKPPKNALEISRKSAFSKKVFQWRNAVAVAAILAIGVLHFAFQMSFINREVSKNRPVVEVPPVRIEPARVEPVRVEPSGFEAKKADVRLSTKEPRTIIRQRAVETAPLKAPPKKKETVETRADRLRRAEKILTGI